ncbi:hypothetical protein C6501_00470 [Candidatus Poribacteria bacterium]|nr:MAG: hypothetical protein C6501_00470 [Candidatus Poribacteria bacterium]
MKSRFKKILKTLCLSFMLLLPVATHAAPTGEIIFKNPKDYSELWIGNVNDGRSAQPLFRLPHDITTFSIQRDGRYIVAVIQIKGKDELDSFHDVYLLDRKNPNAGPKRLTQGEYSEIFDADVSPDGDVVFINHSFVILKKFLEIGLYLIPNQEIQKKEPIAELLLEEDPYQVDWAPNGKKIAYSTDLGIFIFNITTKGTSHIIKDGDFPVFSPNSKHLAFLTKTEPYKIGIVSVVGHRNLRYIEPEAGIFIDHLTWSADGQYLVYTMYNHWDPAFTNFAVHIESGVTERVLETYSNGGLLAFEWATRAYALEPEGLLTTVWGEIKQRK